MTTKTKKSNAKVSRRNALKLILREFELGYVLGPNLSEIQLELIKQKFNEIVKN